MDVAKPGQDAISPLDWTVRHDRVPGNYRRLSDKVLIVFHHACDAMDLEAAEHLLDLLEKLTMRGPRPETGNRRLNVDSLVSAHERLWRLQHPGQD